MKHKVRGWQETTTSAHNTCTHTRASELQTTNKRNPNAAAVREPRMVDVMASDTEPNHEQSPVPEAEVSSPTPGSSSTTSRSSSENSSSDSPSETITNPPTKTVESVRRKVIDVAVEAGPRVVSGAWLFYRKFDKPVDKRGKNTQCQVKATPESDICGRLYKHLSGNGTAPLLDHLKHHHPEEYKLAMESSSKSKQAKAKKGDAYASAVGSCECCCACSVVPFDFYFESCEVMRRLLVPLFLFFFVVLLLSCFPFFHFSFQMAVSSAYCCCSCCCLHVKSTKILRILSVRKWNSLRGNIQSVRVPSLMTLGSMVIRMFFRLSFVFSSVLLLFKLFELAQPSLVPARGSPCHRSSRTASTACPSSGVYGTVGPLKPSRTWGTNCFCLSSRQSTQPAILRTAH